MLRLRFLLLILALLLLSGSLTPVEAARPTRYARAKMHGRRYTHRPFYKLYNYKSHRAGDKKRLNFLRRKATPPARSRAIRRHSTQ